MSQPTNSGSLLSPSTDTKDERTYDSKVRVRIAPPDFDLHKQPHQQQQYFS